MPKQTSIELILEDGQVIAATARTNAALQSVEKTAKHLEESTSFDKFAESIKHGIEDPLGSAGAMAEKLLQTMGPVGAGVAAAFAVIAVGAEQAIEAMEGFAKLGVETQNVSLRTGLLTKEVGQFAFAAKAVGADISIVERMMKGLTNAIEGTDTKAEHARAALKSMGIDIQGLRAGTVSTSETLLALSEGLQKMPNVWERNKLMMDLFKKSGIEAIPFIMKLTEGFATAQKLGLGLSEEQRKRFKKYQEQLEIIDAQWTKLKRDMMDPIVAVVSFIIGDGSHAAVIQGAKQYAKNWLTGRNLPGFHEAYEAYDVIEANVNPQSLDIKNPQPKISMKEDWAEHPFAFFGATYPQTGAGALTRQQDMAAYSRTLAGAEENFAEAQKKAKAALVAYSSEDAAQSELPGLKKKWEDATAAVAKYKAQVDALRKKPGDDAFKLHGGYDDADFAPRRSMIPSLYGPEMAGLGYSDVMAQDVGQTIAAGRTGKSMDLYQTIGQTIVKEFDEEQRSLRAQIEKQVAGIEKGGEQGVSMAGARYGLAMVGKEPDHQVELAQQELAIRQEALKTQLALKDSYEGLFDMQREQYDYENRMQTAQFDFEMKIIQLKTQQAQKDQQDAEAFGRQLVGFTNAAQSGGRRGITDYFRGQAKSLEDTIIGNVGTMAYQKVLSGMIPHAPAGPLGDLLKGTPFAPRTSDEKLLAEATIKNTGATLTQNALLADNTRALSAWRGGGGTGGGFGGGTGGGAFGPEALEALGGGPALASSDWFNMSGASALSNTLRGTDVEGGWGTSTGLGGALSSTSQLAGITGLTAKITGAGARVGGFMQDVSSGAADPMGILFGSTGDDGGYEGTASAGQKVGAMVGLAGAGLAAYSGIKQITKGGAHNVAAGIGTTLMGVAPLTGPAAPFVEAAGMAASFASMLMGDPRQQRGTQISNFLSGHAYAGPDPVSYARSLSGQDIGTDMFGNTRAVGNTTHVTIHAMDSESFGTFLQKHPTQLDAGVYNVISNGNKTVPALRTQLLGG